MERPEKRRKVQCPDRKGTLEPSWLCLVRGWAGGEGRDRTLLAWVALGLKSC